jgi:hypothetical protein
MATALQVREELPGDVVALLGNPRTPGMQDAS